MDSMGFRAIGKQVATPSYHSSPPPPPTSSFSQQAFRVPYNQYDESLTDMAGEYTCIRAIGKQVATPSYHSSPPPPPTSSFSQQAFRVPYNQYDESLTDMAAAYRDNDFGRSVELFRLPSSNVLREEYEREMEKEKIRCRMIAAEIMRKRSLLAALSGPFPDDFSLISASPAFRPRFLARCGSRAIEERLAFSSEERLLGCWNRSGIAGFKRIETVAFQRVPEPRVSEIEPSLEAMLGKNQSGAKRKAVIPLEAGASELHLVDLKKKPIEDWSCSTCQVSATSEQGLYQHLRGKKHKAKEALGTGKNYAIGFFPKKVRQPIKFDGEAVENQCVVEH